MLRGNIPDEIIEAILKHHDIVETVGKYVSLSKRGKNYLGLCPFHSEKTPSFTVSPDKQIFHCFGCGAGGNVIKFVMDVEGMSFPETVRQMAEDIALQVSWEDSAEDSGAQRDADLYEAHELAAKWFHYILLNTEYGRRAMDYLRSRGFSQKLIDTFRIGYAPDSWDSLTQFLAKKEFDLSRMEKAGLLAAKQDGSGYVDRFRDRIMFPIADPKGKVIAFGGRVLQDGQPKYLNSPETPLFTKSQSLYNFHQARAAIRKKGSIVLFEGYVDVIKAWSAGVENGVATLGTALTERHAGILKRNAEHVVLCYDGDNAGLNAAGKSIPLLEAVGLKVTVAQLPDKMDPDEYVAAYGADRFVKDIIEAPVSVPAFRLSMMKRGYRLHDHEDRLRYIKSAVKFVSELASPTEREHYLRQISEEFQYSFDALKQETNEIRSNYQKKQSSGDNNEIPWNNVMNVKRSVRNDIPPLRPAYYNAERQLLFVMMSDRDAAMHVQSHLGDRFNVDSHAAIAAYLYAYYAEHDELNLGSFLSALQDAKLEREASSISLMDINASAGLNVLDDLIGVIKDRYEGHTVINRLKEEVKEAIQRGDDIRAAQIELEIIALERKLKKQDV
ncbi:DNA primase [Paenibacillus turpanensis]|uniref:DNA primase n=1 Tax=Paenibacillus turpanensis TaxID=2689078 RepID=UPI0014085ACB